MKKRPAKDRNPLPQSLFRFAWHYTRRQQLWVLAIVLISMVPYFLSLDLPKQIVNGPIQGRGFETPGATGKFLELTIAFPDWSGLSPIPLFSGFDLERQAMLVALSMLFLFFVLVNGLFKFYINTYKGRLGERMLRRLRYQLIDRVMRFPIPHFRRVKPAEVASMVKDEVDPIGGFVGDAFVTPLFLGGQAITAMVFIMVQSFWLGVIAGGIVVVQAVLIPRLRRRLIELGRQRQITARELAGRVGELVDGIVAVHTNDASNYERADASARLGKIFTIRYELFQRKFFVKFLNNLLAQITPFLFYLIGGYFALKGRLDIGQLVAVIAAYKDLPSPIKELIDWEQQRLDVQVKYAQVIEQFDTPGMLAPELQEAGGKRVDALADGIAFVSASAEDDSGNALFENVNLTIGVGERVAVVGSSGSGAGSLADAAARLLPIASGEVSIDGTAIDDLSEAVTGRRIAYVPADLPLVSGTVFDNLVYGVKHWPAKAADAARAADPAAQFRIAEARLTGNIELDVEADWIDYPAAGAEDQASLLARIRRVLEIADLSAEITNFGLRGRLDPARDPDLAGRVLDARRDLRERLQDEQFRHLVEPFDPERYAEQATVSENLLFGTPVDDRFDPANLAANAYVRQVLRDAALEERFFEMGHEIASTAIELFADLPPDHPFFEQLSFMSSGQIPEYQQVLSRIQGQAFGNVSEADRELILRLPFAYIELRHRMGLLDEEIHALILDARRRFAEGLPAEYRGAVEFYDPESYNKAATIQDNVLFGRIAYGVAGASDSVLKMTRAVFDEHGLHDDILKVGLDYHVGAGGKRTPAVLRQKILLARALLKRPDVLIVNRSLSALDRSTQNAIIERVIAEAGEPEGNLGGIFWVLGNPAQAVSFDRVVVMSKGRVVEDGPPQELLARKGVIAGLIS